jgi:hypothetical protein
VLMFCGVTCYGALGGVLNFQEAGSLCSATHTQDRVWRGIIISFLLYQVEIANGADRDAVA